MDRQVLSGIGQVSLMRLYFVGALLLAVAKGACADVTLEMSQDTIFLTDGTSVHCTFVCRGTRSVIVLVGEQERVYASDDVVRIERGQPSGQRRLFKTAPVGGYEKITSGFVPAESSPPPQPDGAVVEPSPEADAVYRDEQTPFGAIQPEEEAAVKEAIGPEEHLPIVPEEVIKKIRETLTSDQNTEDLLKTVQSLRDRFGRMDRKQDE